MATDISVTFAAAADLLERRDRCHPAHRRRDQQLQMRRTVGRSHTSRRRIGKRLLDDSISTLGADVVAGFETYHVMNPYDDGISMDTYVDWLIEAGHPIARVPDYATWLARFETTLRALPEKQRQASLLPLLHKYQQPQHPINGSSRRQIDCGRPCRKPRSGRTRTSRTSLRRRSSSTSPTWSCSACSRRIVRIARR